MLVQLFVVVAVAVQVAAFRLSMFVVSRCYVLADVVGAVAAIGCCQYCC